MNQTEQMRQIAEYIRQGRCALFVGCDISESASGFRGLPTAWQLAEELADRCNYRGRYRTLPQVAQIFERIYGRQQLIEFMHIRIGGTEYYPLPVHRLIAEIPFRIIASGAWDTLLEQSLTQQDVKYFTIRTETDLAYLDPTSSFLLYKPYGSINDPNSLVITEDDQLNIFYDLGRIIERLRAVIEQHALLLVGYAPVQDSVFVRIYHDIRHAQGVHKPPAFAVQSLDRPSDAAAWEARGVTAIIADPTTFMAQLAQIVATAAGRTLSLPLLAELSDAPRLTTTELVAQGDVLNAAMDRIGIADRIEQTDVPLLSEDQLRDIEAMRAAYERLAHSFAPEQTSARIWLRQGNIEYVRQNFKNAEDYYQRALAADSSLAAAYHNLHFTRLSLGDLVGAIQVYLQAVTLEPSMMILPPRYRLDGVLGCGGLGVVYRVWDTIDDKLVAIKVLHRAQAQTERVLAKFKREAYILRDLSHPNIIKLLDFQHYQGNYFIVMEYLEGQTLKEFLKTTPEPLSLQAAYSLINHVCEALEYTHKHNIIHCDVKPSNIFLVGDQVKLIDFGLARSIDPDERSTLGVATGTIEYMAPEQVTGLPTDCRTDVYAVATVFYEMLTLRNPSQGTYRPPSELRPGFNDALDLVIEKARESAPEARYASLTDFRTELKQVVTMQVAAENAPLLLRLVGRMAQFCRNVTEYHWIQLLFIAILFGVLSPFLGNAFSLRQALRIISVFLVLILVLTTLADWFTVTLARKMHSAPIAAYGRGLGVILALFNGIFWLNSMSFRIGNAPSDVAHYRDPSSFDPLGLGKFDNLQYVTEALVFYVASTLLTTMFVFVTIWAIGAIVHRTGRKFTLGFFIGFFLWILVLGIAIFVKSYGWFGSF